MRFKQDWEGELKRITFLRRRGSIYLCGWNTEIYRNSLHFEEHLSLQGRTGEQSASLMNAEKDI